MVQLADALEKPGKPTFFETPAWSFNMGMVLSVAVGGRGTREQIATAVQIHGA
jgi:hypothetical protein